MHRSAFIRLPSVIYMLRISLSRRTGGSKNKTGRGIRWEVVVESSFLRETCFRISSGICSRIWALPGYRRRCIYSFLACRNDRWVPASSKLRTGRNFPTLYPTKKLSFFIPNCYSSPVPSFRKCVAVSAFQTKLTKRGRLVMSGRFV